MIYVAYSISIIVATIRTSVTKSCTRNCLHSFSNTLRPMYSDRDMQQNFSQHFTVTHTNRYRKMTGIEREMTNREKDDRDA